MKKLLLLLIICQLFVISESYSQLLVGFKAKEGLSMAINAAIDSGYVNPEVIGIGTSPGDYDVGLPISIEFNIDDGKSTAWVYLIRSKDDTLKSEAVGVVKILLAGFLTTPFPVDELGGLGDLARTPIDPNKFIDSDVMSGKITANQDYLDFVQSHNAEQIGWIGCFINELNPVFELHEPYWMMSINSSTGTLICAVHAKTGETICREVTTSVTDNKSGIEIFSVYPNPADEYTMIHFDESSGTRDFLIIYDLDGKIVKQVNKDDLNTGTDIKLELGGLNAGYYFMTISINGKPYNNIISVE